MSYIMLMHCCPEIVVWLSVVVEFSTLRSAARLSQDVLNNLFFAKSIFHMGGFIDGFLHPM